MIRLVPLGIISVFVALIGCSPSGPYPVVPFSGTLTYQGEALGHQMLLTFTPVEGRASTAVVGADGKFKAEYTGDASGVQIGKLVVTLSAYGVESDLPGVPNTSPLSPQVQEALKKYSFDSQGFEIEVTKKETSYKLDLP